MYSVKPAYWEPFAKMPLLVSYWTPFFLSDCCKNTDKANLPTTTIIVFGQAYNRVAFTTWDSSPITKCRLRGWRWCPNFHKHHGDNKHIQIQQTIESACARKKTVCTILPNGACTHNVMVSKFQWKPFWLATQWDPPNAWTGLQNDVNYAVLAQAPLQGPQGTFSRIILCICVYMVCFKKKKKKRTPHFQLGTFLQSPCYTFSFFFCEDVNNKQNRNWGIKATINSLYSYLIE